MGAFFMGKIEYNCKYCNKLFSDYLSNGVRIYCSRIKNKKGLDINIKVV